MQRPLFHDDDMARLAQQDKVLAAILGLKAPLPEEKKRDPTFLQLVRIITEQQISTAAGAALRRRFAQLLGTPTPEELLRIDDDSFRRIGLSRQKTATIRALCTHIGTEPDFLQKVARADDAKAALLLQQIKGIGPWSARIYLSLCEGRRTIWPSGDLALWKGYCHASMTLVYSGETPDRAKTLRVFDKYAIQAFAPHALLAACMLWGYYTRIKPVKSTKSVKTDK